MKDSVQYKGNWLHKNSTAYELYHLWKAAKDEATSKKARKVFEDHFKQVMTNYDLLTK